VGKAAQPGAAEPWTPELRPRRPRTPRRSAGQLRGRGRRFAAGIDVFICLLHLKLNGGREGGGKGELPVS